MLVSPQRRLTTVARRRARPRAAPHGGGLCRPPARPPARYAAMVHVQLPTKLPGGMSARFRVGTQMANAVKDLGYMTEIGYNTFLYSNEADARDLLMWCVRHASNGARALVAAPVWPAPQCSVCVRARRLGERSPVPCARVHAPSPPPPPAPDAANPRAAHSPRRLVERLPKESSDATAEVLGEVALLNRTFSKALARRIESVWTPEPCKSKGYAWRGKGSDWQVEGTSHMVNFEATQLQAPQAGAGGQYPPPPPPPPTPPHTPTTGPPQAHHRPTAGPQDHKSKETHEQQGYHQKVENAARCPKNTKNATRRAPLRGGLFFAAAKQRRSKKAFWPPKIIFLEARFWLYVKYPKNNCSSPIYKKRKLKSSE